MAEPSGVPWPRPAPARRRGRRVVSGSSPAGRPRAPRVTNHDLHFDSTHVGPLEIGTNDAAEIDVWVTLRAALFPDSATAQRRKPPHRSLPVGRPRRKPPVLIITRKPGEKIMLGDDVVVHVMEIVGNSVRVGIQAPRSLPVYREEIWHAVKEENQAAATAAPATLPTPAKLA